MVTGSILAEAEHLIEISIADMNALLRQVIENREDLFAAVIAVGTQMYLCLA